MQYYTLELTNHTKELCVIITPFGQFQYNKALMDVKQSPDFVQEVMVTIFHDMKEIEVYIDDIDIFALQSESQMFCTSRWSYR